MKKCFWLTLLTVTFLVMAAWVRDRITSVYELTGLSEVVRQEKTIYIIDNKGDTDNLFSATQEGEITGRISLQKLDGSWWNSYNNLTVDEDGQVYVYCYGTAMDSNKTRSQVYRCDFLNGKLELLWELPDDKLIRIQVIDGALYYMSPVGEGQTGFYRQKSEQEAERLDLMNVPFDKIKTYFYKPVYGILWADWNSRFYLNEQEIQTASGENRDYVSICAWEGGILFNDMSDKTVRRIRWEAGATGQEEQLSRIDDVVLWNTELEHLDIFPFHIEADGTWTAGIDINAERRVLGIFDRSGQQTAQLSQLTLNRQMRAEQWVQTMCICLVVIVGIGLLIKLALWRTGGTVPIIVQLLGILIPVIVIASAFLDNRIEKSLERRIIRMDYDLLYIMADQILSSLDPEKLSRINLYEIPQDQIYQTLFGGIDYSTLERKVFTGEDIIPEPVIANTYQWMYLLDGGELRYARLSGQRYYGGRVAYDRGNTELEKMKLAMSQKQIVKTEYNDFSGDFVALYAPILDEDGQAIGILESGIYRRILTFEITNQMKQIRALLIGLMTVLILILTAVLGLFLYPLTKVKAAVEDVSRGNLGKVVRVRGRDEVAGIAEAFNHMSLQLKEQVSFIQACSDGYGAFVPKKVFEILGREDITQIELGDQKEISAGILDVNSRQFHTMAKSMNGDELYGLINHMLQEMIPIVTENAGIVDHMMEDGLSAYYPDGSFHALKSAVSICERMNWLKSRGGEVPLYHAVINYGMIRVGIVGQEKRMAASTIAEIMTLSAFLQEVSEKYGAGILITNSAVAQIPTFTERFHSRMIGYLYMHMNQSMEAVYDVYDADEPGSRRAKEETKSLFEEALKDYFAERYYDARLKFAQILRRNPKDLAARAYVYRCDEYYQTKDKGRMQIYLEQY